MFHMEDSLKDCIGSVKKSCSRILLFQVFATLVGIIIFYSNKVISILLLIALCESFRWLLFKNMAHSCNKWIKSNILRSQHVQGWYCKLKRPMP
jgi:hypothetical protein